jgi:hypothetical protein
LDSPWNTLTNLIGPGYQLDGGFFGDSSALLYQAGVLLPVLKEQLQRPRKSAIARSALTTDVAMLTTTDFAVSNRDIIVRWLTVTALQASSELSVQLTLARSSEELPEAGDESLIQQRNSHSLELQCSGGSSDGSTLSLAIPSLKAGESWSKPCFYRFGDREPIDPLQALQDSFQQTSEFIDKGPIFEFPDPKVADLIEGSLITFWTQTAESGLVSPLNRYTKGWLRDSEGPVRVYLDLGYFQESRQILDATYAIAVADHSIANSFSLDAPQSQEDPEDPDQFWNTASFMPGREPVEAPSYPVLLYARYTEATGEVWNDARTSFLKACIRRQEQSSDGRMRFSGDETFRYPMALALGTLPEELGWSANSSLLYQAASETLGLSSNPDILEQFYNGGGFISPISQFEDNTPWPAPSEDVSLQASWSGGTELEGNLESVISMLMQEDGTLLSKDPSGNPVPAYTGMVPGYFLNALAKAHHPNENLAFQALDLIATPTGHFEEVHSSTHQILQLTHDPSGYGADVSARYRPWETGNVTHALLHYLLGAEPDPAAGLLTLAPHLPSGWPYLKANGMPMGSSTWGIQIEDYEEGFKLVLSGEGPWLVRLTLHLRLPVQKLWVNGERTEGEGAVVELVETLSGELEVVGSYARENQ